MISNSNRQSAYSNNQNKHRNINRDNNYNNQINTYQTNLRQYSQSTQIHAIMNMGYIDNVKASSNTRILSLNPNSIQPSNEEKVNMLMNSCIDKQIDIVLLSKMNIKWTASNIEKMRSKLAIINKNIVITTADTMITI